MPDAGSPFGFDIATSLVGSGLTLLVTAAIVRYGNRVSGYAEHELYAIVGGALLVFGLGFGLGLVVTGRR